MGARTLELTLRRRLLAVLAPALACVAIATVAIVGVALRRADESAARDRARTALHLLRSELAEGDAVPDALEEVVRSNETEGVRVWMGHAAVASRARTAEPRVADGECAAFSESGGGWCACAVADGSSRAVVAVSTSTHDGVVRAAAAGTAIVTLVALLLAVVASRRSLRRPVQAVDALVAWAEELVRRQAPTPAPASEASAETARLAIALDSLVRRLFDALERERAQSAYIAHELRTPLTAMRAELERLSAKEPTAAKLVEDVDQLSRALDAILVLAQPRDTQTAGAIVNVADLARDLAPAAVAIDAPDEALVEGDEDLLALAMRNLLENAAKHGGGVTHVAVRRSGDLVEVAVRDEGAGLRADDLRHVFEPHRRASTSAAGSGLGLALVAAVAARHGGDADARPNPAGRGLEVRLRVGAVVGWHE